jgi:FtsZ-binding cell division protein ZapB
MDLGVSLSSMPEILAAIAVGVVAIALGLRKLHTIFAKDSVMVARVNSELDIINLLREQIQDLGQANKDLRVEIDELRRLNNSLVIENEEIKKEIRLLREQVSAMKEFCPECPNKRYF